VANRSTGGVETGRLHPTVNEQINNVSRIFLFMFGFNGFKIALFASQDFCAETPAIRAQDFFVGGMIFPKASHALHFGRYKTDMQLHLFRVCAFADRSPLILNGDWVEFGKFTEGKLKTSNPIISVFLNLAKYLIKNRVNDLQFAHAPLFNDNQ
jgi:hypothetical protein